VGSENMYFFEIKKSNSNFAIRIKKLKIRSLITQPPPIQQEKKNPNKKLERKILG
jgi:hypothetical protein